MKNKRLVGMILVAVMLCTSLSLILLGTQAEGEDQADTKNSIDYNKLYVDDVDGDGVSDRIMLFDAFSSRSEEGELAVLTDRDGKEFSLTGGAVTAQNGYISIGTDGAITTLVLSDVISEKGATVEISAAYRERITTGDIWYMMAQLGGKSIRYRILDGVWERTYFESGDRNEWLQCDGIKPAVWLKADTGTRADFAVVVNKDDVGGMQVIGYRDAAEAVSGSFKAAMTDTTVRLFGQSGNYQMSQLDVYAIRVYSKPLSEAQLKQNRFADLVRYYELDVSAYLAETDEALKGGIVSMIASQSIGSANKEEMQAKIDGYLMTGGVLDNFSVDEYIVFNGFQNRIKDYAAVRALFTVYPDRIAFLEESGFDVEYGTIMADAEVWGETLPEVVYDKETNVYNAPQGAEVTVFYKNGEYGADFAYKKEDVYQFAATYTAGEDGRDDQEYVMRAYLALRSRTTGKRVLVYVDTQSVLFGRGVSLQETSTYFLYAGFVHSPILQQYATTLDIAAATAMYDDYIAAEAAYREASDSLMRFREAYRSAEAYYERNTVVSGKLTVDMARHLAVEMGSEAETSRYNTIFFAEYALMLAQHARQQAEILYHSADAAYEHAYQAALAEAEETEALAIAEKATQFIDMYRKNLTEALTSLDTDEAVMTGRANVFSNYTAILKANAAVGNARAKLQLNDSPLGHYVIVTESVYEELALALQKYLYSRFTVVIPVYLSDNGSVGSAHGMKCTINLIMDRTLAADCYRITATGTTISLAGGDQRGIEAASSAFLAEYASGNLTGRIMSTVPEKAEVKRYHPLISLDLPETFDTAFSVSDYSAKGTLELFYQAVEELPAEVALVSSYDVEHDLAGKYVMYVALDGDDTAAGTIDQPLATLHEAVSRMQYRGGGVIYLRGGIYMLQKSVMLDSTHSGSIGMPLVISAYPGEEVLFTTETSIKGSDFVPATGEILNRLDADVRAHIMQVDLKSYGITEYGASNQINLYANHRMQDLARYPDAGEYLFYESAAHMNIVRFALVTNGTSSLYGKGDNLSGWEFGLADDEPLTWQWDDDIWLYGTPYLEWDKNTYPITSINHETKTMTSDKTSSYGVLFNKDNYFYYFNVLEELNTPGEWYLDKDTGILYYYPQEGMDMDTAIFHYADPSKFFAGISMLNTENVVINNINFSSLKHGVVCDNTRNVLLQHCTVSNTADSSFNVNNSFLTGVIYSDFSYAGQPMANFNSGNYDLSNPNHCFVQNCHFAGMYPTQARGGAGVLMYGVGNVVSHNEFDNTTISAHGIESIYEYNIIIGGAQTSHDWGPLYIGGSGNRHGQHVRYNQFYNLTYCLYGIYLDDLSSGHFVYGNIVHYKDDNGDYNRGVNIHGGRENVVFNNIVIGANFFGVGAPDAYTNSTGWITNIKAHIADRDATVDETAYAKRYPIYTAYAKEVEEFYLAEGSPTTSGAVKDVEWMTLLSCPSNNIYLNNALIDCGTASGGSPVKTATTEANYIDQGNFVLADRNEAGFADEAKGDFTLPSDSVIYEQIPDFIPIQTERMGILSEN